MTFIQPCFIKNTPEIRQKLEDMDIHYDGYEGRENKYIYIHIGPYTNTYSTSDILHEKVFYVGTEWLPYFDCGDNEALFLALAALRDDTNDHQWFIAQDTMWDENYYGEITVYYEEGEWLQWGEYSFMEDMPSSFKKATAEEIIAYFNSTTNGE